MQAPSSSVALKTVEVEGGGNAVEKCLQHLFDVGGGLLSEDGKGPFTVLKVPSNYFQSANKANQLINLKSVMAPRLERLHDMMVRDSISVRQGKFWELAYGEVCYYRDELLYNYYQWLKFTGLKPPPPSLQAATVSMAASVVDETGSQTSNASRQREVKSRELAREAVKQIALFLLVWGEGANLRFCPEVLCFIYHSLSIKPPSEGNYLEDIVTPAYNMLFEQFGDSSNAPFDHTAFLNYDDFNEMFWNKEKVRKFLATPTAATPFTVDERTNRSMIKEECGKTYAEHWGWMRVCFNFWRVFILHFVLLHILILFSICQSPISYKHGDECTLYTKLSPTITLYLCILLKAAYELGLLLVEWSVYIYGNMKHTNPVRVRDGIGGLFLPTTRFLTRLGVSGFLSWFVYKANWGGGNSEADDNLFKAACALAIVLYLGTELMYIIRPRGMSLAHPFQGTWNPITQICSVIYLLYSATLLDSNNLYTRIARYRSWHHFFTSFVFWVLVLSTKFVFDFYFVVKPLVQSSIDLYGTSVSKYVTDGVLVDEHNVVVIIALWCSTILVYFFDMQIFFSLWTSVAGVLAGLYRNIGQVTRAREIIRRFPLLPDRYFRNMDTNDKEKTLRFGFLWNDIVRSMRDEDIISDEERVGLSYVMSSKEPGSEVLQPSFLFNGNFDRLLRPATQLYNEHKSLFDHTSSGDNATKIKERARASLAQKEVITTHFEDGMSMRMLRQVLYSLRRLLCTRPSSAAFLSANLEHDAPDKLASELHEIAVLLLENETKMGPIFSDVYHEKRNQVPFYVKLWRLKDVRDALNALLVSSTAVETDSTYKTRIVLTEKFLEELKHFLEPQDYGRNEHGEVILNNDGTPAPYIRVKPEQATKKMSQHKRVQTVWLNKIKTLRDLISNYNSGDVKNIAAFVQSMHDGDFIERLRQLTTSKLELGVKPGKVLSEEGNRRIRFFVNSLFMQAPVSEKIKLMPSWCTLTPYYDEETILPISALGKQEATNGTAFGVTTLEYLQTVTGLEWKNFMQRIQRRYPEGTWVIDRKGSVTVTSKTEVSKAAVKDVELQLRLWASYRAQTLARTVRGIMYNRRAIQVLALVDDTDNQESTFDAWTSSAVKDVVEMTLDDEQLEEQFKEVADERYRYIVSAQAFQVMVEARERVAANALDPTVVLKGNDRQYGQKATDIEYMAKTFPGLQISWVKCSRKVYSSCIGRPNPETGILESTPELEVILPGNIILGEKKPNNQNHALIFTRGEAVQVIDMNQDMYLEEAFKQRRLLGEFKFRLVNEKESGPQKSFWMRIPKRRKDVQTLTVPKPQVPAVNYGRIVGFREHVFTGGVSSTAKFFSLQERGFVTGVQRVIDGWLSVRFHYGHPDIFDRTSLMTLGGASKASKAINLSEDIFSGFSWILRGGTSTQADYIEAGKGRDVGLDQLYGYTAKISMGNGMQARSREAARLSYELDYFRFLSFFYSSIGGFLTTCILMGSMFIYLYMNLIMSSANTMELLAKALGNDFSKIFSSVYLYQMGFLTVIPVVNGQWLEVGFAPAWDALGAVMFRCGLFYSGFQAGTTAWHVNNAITKSKAVYHATGRGFRINHVTFLDSFKLYLLSHFEPATEALLLLVTLYFFTFQRSAYLLQTFAIYFAVIAYLWSPTIFNAQGLDSTLVLADFTEWKLWMDGYELFTDKCWIHWFKAQAPKELPFRHKLEVSIWHCRFFLLAGVYLKAVSSYRNDKYIGVVYTLPSTFGVVIIMMAGAAIVEYLKNFSQRRQDPNDMSNRALWIRVPRKRSIYFTLTVIVAGAIFGVLVGTNFTFRVLLLFFMGFVLVMYGILKILVLWYPRLPQSFYSCIWFSHYVMGVFIQMPLVLLSILPFLVDFQHWLLFNHHFSRLLSRRPAVH